MGKFIDMTGWVMKEHGVPESRLTVIDRAPSKDKHVFWNCICECGTKVVVRGDQLKRGIAKSCGCLQREVSAKNMIQVGKSNKNKISSKRKDLSGQRFGILTVIDFSHRENKHLFWNCKCDCGRTLSVSADHLCSGHTKSCGCNSFNLISESNIKDYTNQKIGKLLVLDKIGIKEHLMYWKCKCDCGNECIVSSSYLKNSKKPSCGCIKSIGEATIKQCLNQLDYKYKKEYIFADLIDLSNLRFDFAIFKNNQLSCVIEYQGEQHFIDTSRGVWKSPLEHDILKRKYCQEHNIKLIEIPYWDLQKINTEYLKELIEN